MEPSGQGRNSQFISVNYPSVVCFDLYEPPNAADVDYSYRCREGGTGGGGQGLLIDHV